MFSDDGFRQSIIFSKHAIKRMNERKISLDEVLEILSSPLGIIYDKHNDVYIALGHQGTAVVYAFRANRIEVLTVLRKREFSALQKKFGERRYKPIWPGTRIL